MLIYGQPPRHWCQQVLAQVSPSTRNIGFLTILCMVVLVAIKAVRPLDPVVAGWTGSAGCIMCIALLTTFLFAPDVVELESTEATARYPWDGALLILLSATSGALTLYFF